MRRPPFDPELEAVLALVNDQIKTITPEMIPVLRAAGNQAEAVNDMLQAAGVARRDITIPGHEGAPLKATLYARADRAGTGPGIYQLHGGGMVMGDATTGVSHFLPWIVEHNAVVVAPEYRLAPEFPDPYPIEDCYAGLVWTAENAVGLGIDPDRLLITGASAGGGLAAGTALLARDRDGPRLIGQLLIYPMLDDRDATVSTQQYDGVGLWTRESNLTGWNALLGKRRGTDAVSPYAAPARATDFSALPPAYIDCGSAEVFRDEDVAYATALWHSGVQAELHIWPGGFHGFDILAPHTAIARAMTTARNAWVARVFSD
ncbi:alpha/beta hydrolase [Dietzia lutea]|uniref:Lipase n=1 Tax=Dietzia lutea TaxID=546160 RepID=A0A2S1R3V6_9ACTN|nr:alpha/beta hydrolase [Dietzia lutea]AWH90980.1 lipase [Dietzia lutea]